MFNHDHQRIWPTIGRRILSLLSPGTKDDDATTLGQVNGLIDHAMTGLNGSNQLSSTTDGVTFAEKSFGANHVTAIKLTNVIIDTLPGSAVDQAMGVLLCDFSSVYVLKSYRATLTASAEGSSVAMTFGLGSAQASGAHAVVGDAGATAIDFSNNTTVFAAAIDLDEEGIGVGTGILNIDANQIYLNVAAAWNADNENDLVVNGSIVLEWTDLID